MKTFYPFLRLTAVMVMGMPQIAAAQNYPVKTIRWIVPFPPGGGVDMIARTLAQKLSESWSQQVVVDNRPGSGGTTGLDAASKAPADGYTLSMAQLANMALAPAFYPKLAYDPQKDLAPVTLVLSAPFMLLAHPSVPAKNMRELIALARARPDELSFGSSGNGSLSHLAGEMVKSMAGVRMVHVPYKGVALATSDIFSGRIPLYFSGIPPVVSWVKSGRVKALGMTSARRSHVFPEVPTIAESGLPGYDASNWYGIVVPARTPAPVVTRLNSELTRILQLPDVKTRFQDEGGDVTPTSPEQFAAFINREIPRWAKIVKDSAARID